MLPSKNTTVNLRTVAETVGLAPCSVSAVLNRTPASRAIPRSTQDRIFRAAAELNYRPNLWARSLRTKRTRMVAAIAPDFGRADIALVLAGAHRRLQEKGYLLVLGTIETDDPNQLSARFAQRGIEGVIAIDATVPLQRQFPVASVHLHSEISMHSSPHEVRTWLAEIGQSSAEAIVSQIEGPGKPRTMPAQPKVPAHFDPLAAWAARGDSRESA